MRAQSQGSGDLGREERASSAAVSAFLYLGERLALLPSAGAPAKSLPLPPEAAQTLLRAIEGDIIPRLLLAHKVREAPPAAPIANDATLCAADHEHFLQLVLNDTAASTRAFVGELIRRGVAQETVFLDLLGGAARRLGELWEEDRCSFTDVTIGLCRLHEVLREHSTIHDRSVRQAAADGPRILMATACGDQHVFGVVIVAEFFRRAGWRVWSEPGAACRQLAAILGEVRFDVLGLSAHCTAFADDVASEIETLRKASCNGGLRVLVGGRLFLEQPELVERVGADGWGADARAALATAHGLLAAPGAIAS